jgi:hypothetical protein
MVAMTRKVDLVIYSRLSRGSTIPFNDRLPIH